MRSILFTLLIGLTIPMVSNADEVKTLKCQLRESYLKIETELTVRLQDSIVSVTKSKEGTVVAWSESECEDNTEIQFAKGDFERLANGSTVYPTLIHDGPDIDINGLISCVGIK